VEANGYFIRRNHEEKWRTEEKKRWCQRRSEENSLLFSRRNEENSPGEMRRNEEK